MEGQLKFAYSPFDCDCAAIVTVNLLRTSLVKTKTNIVNKGRSLLGRPGLLPFTNCSLFTIKPVLALYSLRHGYITN